MINQKSRRTLPKESCTSADFQEAFIKLNNDFHKWALTRTEVWRAEMLEHRNKIVKGIQQAIEEKIKPL